MPTRSTEVLRHLRPPVPDAVARRAAAWPGTGAPAVPTASASVILVRDAAAGGGAEPDRAAHHDGWALRATREFAGTAGAEGDPSVADALGRLAEQGGVEVYLLHRHARMPFAPLMAVFPGGKVDPVDRADPEPARACGLRETAEETGVLLDRADLRPWAHWITPEVEPLRFDTEFFVAPLPPGQEAADLSGETERAGWVSAVEALEQRERHELSLMPPTWAILAELASAPDVAAVLAAAADRVVETVLPRPVRGPDGWTYAYLRPDGSPLR